MIYTSERAITQLELFSRRLRTTAGRVRRIFFFFFVLRVYLIVSRFVICQKLHDFGNQWR